MESSPSENQYHSLLRVSCAKIVNSRHRRGGASLRKNLLVLGVIARIQVTQSKLEAMRTETVELLIESEPEEEEDMDEVPPLEFSVTDADEASTLDGEVAFASEAIEEEEVQPLSPALDDALRVAADRKRKGEIRPPAPRQKTQRVGERCVPSATKY